MVIGGLSAGSLDPTPFSDDTVHWTSALGATPHIGCSNMSAAESLMYVQDESKLQRYYKLLGSQLIKF